jgi:hypothetical protein
MHLLTDMPTSTVVQRHASSKITFFSDMFVMVVRGTAKKVSRLLVYEEFFKGSTFTLQKRFIGLPMTSEAFARVLLKCTLKQYV